MSRLPRSHKLLACCLLVFALLALGAWRGTVAEAAAPWQDSTAPSQAPGAAAARLIAGAGVRSGPGERYLLLTITSASEEHAILGRSSDGLWWRIDFRGQPAWVAAAQVKTQAIGVPVVRIGGPRL